MTARQIPRPGPITRNVLLAGALVATGAAGGRLSAVVPDGDTVYLLPGQQVLVVGAPAPSPSASVAPSESVGPTASPSESPAATPTPSPAPTPSPTPVPTPTPVPVPTPTPVPTPLSCSTPLQAVVDATPAGSTVDLGACVYSSATLNITKAITIRRGTLKPVAQHAVAVRANDVTFDGTTFDGGGGWTVDIWGVDRTTFLGTTFLNAGETYVRLVGPGIDGVLFDGATFKVKGAYSAVSCDDNGPYGTDFRNITFRGITLDNGPQGVGWFGIECWGVQNLLIEGSVFKGDDVHISIPRSDGAIIRNNTFDLTQVGWAAIELADIDNSQVTGNVATGASAAGGMWKAFIQMHQGSGAVRNNVIEGNRLTNFAALFNAAEVNTSGNIVRNNCLQNVPRVFWGNAAGYALTNNGPCP